MSPNTPLFSLKGSRVVVMGHRGMVGSSIVRALENEACEIITVGKEVLDLKRQTETENWLLTVKPDVIFLAAATVGGIWANNQRPAEFIYDNLAIEANVIHGAWKADVKKLLFLGSSCIYPRAAPQPIEESALLSGELEQTNQWYAIAKIAGIKLCQAYRRQYGCDFISAMPTNLYGIGDNYHPEYSHVVPGLIRRIHLAKVNKQSTVEVWGTGTPHRELLYVDDLADALIHIIKHYSDEKPINVGTGQDITISELAKNVSEVVGYNGDFVFNPNMPDGTPRKLLNVEAIQTLGWRAKTELSQGLSASYRWFLDNIKLD